MKTITKKQAIVQSVDAMNEREMEKVVDFIRELLHTPEQQRNYQEFKQRAMNEIQEALKRTN